MNNKSGVTLVTMVIIVIVIVIISTISIIGGTEIIGEAKESKREDNLAAVKAKINDLSLKQGTAGVFTPANFKKYGKVASAVLSDDAENLEGWYILDKEDLEEMGLKYVDESYLVNYDDNVVITMNEYRAEGVPGGKKWWSTPDSVGAFVKENKIEVGDYVNYIPDNKSYVPDATKFGYTNSTMTTASATWRVWDIDESTGEVLISTECEVNPFTAKVFLGVDDEITSEVDKICEKLYSSAALNLKGKRLTMNDINKAFAYNPVWEYRRNAYYARDEEVVTGDKVMYKGEEYIISKGDDIYYTISSSETTVLIEGGEEVTGVNGLKGITPVKGKPLYVVKRSYTYNPSEYNTVLAAAIKDDPTISYGYTWISEVRTPGTYTFMNNGAKMYGVLTDNRTSFSSSSLYLGFGGMASSGGYPTTNSYNIRPAVVLNATTLLDVTDASRDGKTAETAWNFKY